MLPSFDLTSASLLNFPLIYSIYFVCSPVSPRRITSLPLSALRTRTRTHTHLTHTQGFAQNDSDPDANTRAATMGVCFLFLVHCFLQCRDSLFARPHPGVWRIVHGIGMLYLFGVAVLLIHP